MKIINDRLDGIDEGDIESSEMSSQCRSASVTNFSLGNGSENGVDKDGLDIVYKLQSNKYKEIKQQSIDITFRYMKEGCIFSKMFMFVEDDLVKILSPMYIKLYEKENEETIRNAFRNFDQIEQNQFRDSLNGKFVDYYDLLVDIIRFDKTYSVDHSFRTIKQTSTSDSLSCPLTPNSHSHSPFESKLYSISTRRKQSYCYYLVYRILMK